MNIGSSTTFIRLRALALGALFGFAIASGIQSLLEVEHMQAVTAEVSGEPEESPTVPSSDEDQDSEDLPSQEIANEDTGLVRVRLKPDKFVLPKGGIDRLDFRLTGSLTTTLTPAAKEILELTEGEVTSVEGAIGDCVTGLKRAELLAARQVVDPDEGEYILIEARPREGKRLRDKLIADLTHILGNQRARVMDVLLDGNNVFNGFLAHDRAKFIIEDQTDDGRPTYSLETRSVINGALSSTSESRSLVRLDRLRDRWGHIFQSQDQERD